MEMEYGVVVVAAGVGSRVGLGYNKVFYRMKTGCTMIEQTLSLFIQDERCKQIVVVCREEEEKDFKQLCKSEKIEYAYGGATRSDSVQNGLANIKTEYVLIHDGARPWLSNEALNRLLETLATCHACLLMVPSKDTIKIVENGVVKTTPNRDTLWCAQTPQAFATKLLRDCFKQLPHDVPVSDDASVVERCGYEVKAVMGEYENRKVTTIDDLVF